MKKREKTSIRKLNKKALTGIIGFSLICIALVLFLIFGKSNEFKISFDTLGGSMLNSQKIKKDEKISRPIDPIKEGYIFDNWYVDGEVFDFDKPISKNITLEARWILKESIEDDNKFTIIFDTDGGSKIESLEVEKDSRVTEPNPPTKDGHDFLSWQLEGKEFDFNTLVTNDITLIAKWEKKTTNTTTETIKHRVTFNSNGGTSISSKLVVKGTTVPKPKNPTRSGYTFEGWYLNNKLFNFSTKIYDNITIAAKWKENVSNITYSINWVKIESSSIGQYTLYIRSSEGINVAGKAKITTTAGTTSVVDIPSSGKTYIKSAISSAIVDSVN